MKTVISTDIGFFQTVCIKGYVNSAKFVEETDISNVGNEITDYFNGNLKTLNGKIKLVGTDFQKSVWREIIKIPYGETRTYSQIAVAIGKPTAYRAVANACGQNKLAIYVPCHRVVGKNNIGGYRWSVSIKEWLINFEKTNV